MQVLELSGVTKRFSSKTHPAVDNVNLRVEPGELFGLLGPSGCGKTTTLRIIAGFEVADSGTVTLHGRDITSLPPERRKTGLVFQDYALFPHLSVLKNVIFALPRSGTDCKRLSDRAGRTRRADELLELVGLLGLRSRMPDELSGGQQQRVALARALAADPQLLLLDEPFSNLDAGLRETTRRDVRHLLKEAGINAILVTHDQEEALSFCDRLAVMHAGRIEQTGRPEEIYHRPATAFVAQFLGRANLFTGHAAGSTAETPFGRIAITQPAQGKVLLSLRPEHLEVIPVKDRSIAAEIVSREFRGHDLTYRVRFGDRAYLAHTEYLHSFQPGQMVRLVPREPAVVLRDDV